MTERCPKCLTFSCTQLAETRRHNSLVAKNPSYLKRKHSEERVSAAQDACDARRKKEN